MADKRTATAASKVDGIRRLLEEAETRPAKPAKRAPRDELDLDGAWNKS